MNLNELPSSAIIVGEFDVSGAVFVVPLDAPIPSEISGAVMPIGSLYKRLAALDHTDTASFSFVPVSGAELLALERAWRSIQSVGRVYVLADLPAARYDVLFSQAVRQIGLQTIEWSRVSDAMAAKLITDQRTRDKTPWVEPMVDGVEVPRRRGPVSSSGSSASLNVPRSYDDEDQA